MQVNVVLDASEWVVDNAINDAAVARLESAGLEVHRMPTSPTTHAKVLKCDERVLVGDTNWSYTGLTLVHGVTLQSTTAGLAAEYDDYLLDRLQQALP